MTSPTFDRAENGRPIAKTARGMDGRVFRLGDHVVSKCGVVCVVLEMWKQGYDGTIVRTDVAPDPDYPHHKQGAAKTTYRKGP